MDAAFLSPHKFLGGPGSSGVLVIKKSLLRNSVPTVAGGGTVFYVSDEGHSYIQNFEEREEAGTPNIVADIRCGMVFNLHHRLQLAPNMDVYQTEARLHEKLMAGLRAAGGVEILGEHHKGEGFSRDMVPIVSFMVRHRDSNLYLHYNFVATLLNDLFGVQ